MSVLAVALPLLSGACGGGSLVPRNEGGTGLVGGDASRDVRADGSVGFDAGAADVAPDAIVDAGAEAAAEVGRDPIYCGGGVTCFGTDLCVIRTLCDGSVPDCAPPPPFCTSRPDACVNNGVSCACLSPTLCPASACWDAQGRVVFCAIELGIDASVDAIADGAVDAGAADVARDATRDAATADGDAGTGLACGAALTCYGTDLCVTLNLCGGSLRCDAVPDGGQCPAGSTLFPDCPGGGPGCMPDCPGPSYSCAPRPAACTTAVDCSCLGSSFCPFSGCVHVQGRAVLCANI